MKKINSRWLMVCSSLFYALLALTGSFIPGETLQFLALHQEMVLPFQMYGAACAGFAIMNWMAKGNTIGGIYYRPVALGNALHFFMVGMVLFKTGNLQWYAAPFLLFAVLFLLLVFGPSLNSKEAE